MTEKWTLDRGYIRDENGNCLASVPCSLGDKSDHVRARFIVKAPELRDIIIKLQLALDLHHTGQTTTLSFRHTYEHDEKVLRESAKLLEGIATGEI